MTGIWKQVFVHVIKLKTRSSVWTLIRYSWCPDETWKCHVNTHGRPGTAPREDWAEVGVLQLPT